jgi:hypothetical protein
MKKREKRGERGECVCRVAKSGTREKRRSDKRFTWWKRIRAGDWYGNSMRREEYQRELIDP